MSYLQEQDRIKEELKRRHPGWAIWYVPQVGRDSTWCAQPWPRIQSTSPEQLEADIAQAHAEAAENWPALAPEPPVPVADGPLPR